MTYLSERIARIKRRVSENETTKFNKRYCFKSKDWIHLDWFSTSNLTIDLGNQLNNTTTYHLLWPTNNFVHSSSSNSLSILAFIKFLILVLDLLWPFLTIHPADSVAFPLFIRKLHILPAQLRKAVYSFGKSQHLSANLFLSSGKPQMAFGKTVLSVIFGNLTFSSCLTPIHSVYKNLSSAIWETAWIYPFSMQILFFINRKFKKHRQAHCSIT